MQPVHVEADTTLTFTGSKERQVRGRYPSISVNDDGKVIELHQPSFGPFWSGKLCYQVGTILDNFSIRWSQEVRTGELSAHPGSYARVALNNRNIVVVVYETSRRICYQFGNLNTKSEEISWTGQGEISRGRYPAIALNNAGQVVVAYESRLIDRTYYRTAQLQTGVINWSEEGRLFTDSAKEISVAMNQVGRVVAVARGGSNKLYFKVGELQSIDGQLTLNWEGDHDIQSEQETKCRPSISINDENKVVVAYQTKNGRQLSYRVGEVENSRITWIHRPINYDMGCNPTIALCNNNKWVEEHETNSAHRGHTLFHRVGQLHNLRAIEVGEDDQPPQDEDEQAM